MKTFILILLLTSTVCVAEDPDAPQPQAPVHSKLTLAQASAPRPQAARFFTFRKSWEAPLLKPDKASWAIIAGAHALAWGAVIYDVRHTHGVRESSSEYLAVGLMTGMDVGAAKLFSPSFAVGAPIYAIQHYLRDAFR